MVDLSLSVSRDALHRDGNPLTSLAMEIKLQYVKILSGELINAFQGLRLLGQAAWIPAHALTVRYRCQCRQCISTGAVPNTKINN